MSTSERISSLSSDHYIVVLKQKCNNIRHAPFTADIVHVPDVRSFGMKYSPYISVAPIYNSNCAGASTTLFGAPSCVLVSCDAIMLHRYTWFATPFRVATSCDGTCCGVTPCDVRSLQRQTLYGVTSCGATSCVFAMLGIPPRGSFTKTWCTNGLGLFE